MSALHKDFLAKFQDERKPLVEAVLGAVREVCPDLSETIKWNAPNFCDEGKDRLTLMLHKKDSVSLILHAGTGPKEDKTAPPLFQDDTGLLAWNSNIRAMITFLDVDDFLSKRSLFKTAVQRWIEETKRL